MINFVSSEGHLILLAFWMTLKVSALSAAGSLILGTVLAAMRVAPLSVLRAVGTIYVNILRNTPLTLVILFCGPDFPQWLVFRLFDADQRGIAQLINAGLNGEHGRSRHIDELEVPCLELALDADARVGLLDLHDDRRVRPAEKLGENYSR